MKSPTKRKTILLLLIIVLIFTTTACRLGGPKELPIDYSFMLLPGDILTFNITFNEPVDGFTMYCEDHSTGYSGNVISDVDMSAPYFVSVNAYAGWAWQPNQTVELSADGYETISITLPEYGTAEWDQFVFEMQSASFSASSDLPVDSGISDLNLCEKAQEEYADCMYHYETADSSVDQILWLNTCQGWQDQINRNCQ